jgi:hypothetical protein
MPTPRFIDWEEYYNFAGIDLEKELNSANYDNTSDYVDIFITRVEDWCEEYLFMKYGVSKDYPKDKDGVPIFNEVAFKKGLLYQIDYLRRNGDLSIQAVNEGKVLAPNAYMVWKNAGMCNVAHKNIQGVIDPWV